MSHDPGKEPSPAVEPRLAEGPLREFIERSNDLVTVVDDEGRFLYVNPVAERVFGVPPAECLGRSAFEFVHEEDREETRTLFRSWLGAAPEGSIAHENRQVNRSTGECFHLLWTIMPLAEENGRVRRLVSSARDITELRRVEAELSASELHLRALLAGMLDALIAIDPEGIVLEASDSCHELFGYAPDELCGRNVKILMPEPHRSKHDEYLARYRESGETWILNTTREFEVLHRDGHLLVCELSVSRIDVPDSGETFYCGSFRDVTARKTAERALARSERRFRAVFHQEFQYVGLLDSQGVLLEINQAALAAGKLERGDVLGKHFAETGWWAHSLEDRDYLRKAIRRAAGGEFVRYEAEYTLVGGEFRTVDFSLKPVVDEDGALVSIVAEGRDITEMKRAQRRETSMLRALATIGESASVLAHEIKNPITAVNSALRAVADQLGEDQQEVLEELVVRMKKLEMLMRRTLSLAKPLDLHLAPVSVETLFRNVEAALREELESAETKLVLDVAEGTPPLLADAGLVEEVLTNLVKNALEAVEFGGRIRLSAGPDGARAVELCVEDNGPGIDDSIRGALFQPFITTKSSGTGIGLALCRKVVEEHGGSIAIGTSELGGALFRSSLPAVPR